MSDQATIAFRFHGPPDSGNGGYSCGILGSLIGGCASVSLKAPPPLETPLTIENDGDEWSLFDGDRLIALGRPAELNIEIPSPPSVAEATAAEANYTGHETHPFPSCFTCGPDRAEHDGLRIFAGQVPGREIVASRWHPEHDVAGEFGAVSSRVVWAALDCPTYFGAQLETGKQNAVLGTLTAELSAPVEVGRDHVVIAWPIDADERKFRGGSAVFTSGGDLCAAAVGTWVKIDPERAAFNVAG